MSPERKEEKRQRPHTTPLEWAVALAGALLVALTVGYMLWTGVTQPPDATPRVVVTVDSIIASGGSWVVRFTARNEGAQTAASVGIEGALMDGDVALETARAALDYVPARSERSGGLFFQRDPRAHRIILHASGYAEP